MQAKPRSVSLATRLLIALIVGVLLPLVAITGSALRGYHNASTHAQKVATTALDTASLAPLQQRTMQTAENIGDFLDARASDVRAVALLRPDQAAYTQFVATRSDEWWYVTGTRAAPVPHREQLPFYRELVAVDGTGHVLADIVDGKPQTNPDAASFTAYFDTAKTLAPNAISVSHLSRLYVPRLADEAELPPGAGYANFNGVYRFIAARRTATGAFDGAVMLALDARHIMDFVVHIDSTGSQLTELWPDVPSGDYGQLFDDQGWTIVHPNLWMIRGNDANGQPVPPQTAQMSPEERDRHPFNVRLGAWADPNLPNIFASGLSGKSDALIIGNDPNDNKAITYAPIPFHEGDYANGGVFGVLAIAANTEEFHQSSATVAAAITDQRTRFQLTMAVVIALSLILMGLVGFAINRSLIRPLKQLTIVARELEEGRLDEERLTALRKRPFADEVTVLTNVFAQMGRQIVQREQQLRSQIADLHIQIDSRRRQQQVDEITETDYFRNLRDTATRLRSQPQDGPAPKDDPK
jgi:HAMP domain-containing protein